MFMCGVCEGFYGKPWTTQQRKELFVRMRRFGMTTYLYAPKDDYKHRLHWRNLYSKEEAGELRSIISAARAQGVDFVYAISPGLDMMFSDPEDVEALTTKLKQVAGFGCGNFALLFDDIDSDLCIGDEEKFKTVGNAQAAITNAMYSALGQPPVFLFCPTEYCNSRADPDLYRSEYLKTIGETLHKGVSILWTGTKVVPRRLTIENIIEVKEVLQRPPVIWENLHANDYDQTRVYLGPYSGRPAALQDHLSGVLTNPNCEFEANWVAMHTLAQWSRNHVTQFPPVTGSRHGHKDVSPPVGGEDDGMETAESLPSPGYQPQLALTAAVTDWIPEFYRAKGASSSMAEKKERRSNSRSKSRSKSREHSKSRSKSTSESADSKSASTESAKLSDPPKKHKSKSSKTTKKASDEKEKTESMETDLPDKDGDKDAARAKDEASPMDSSSASSSGESSDDDITAKSDDGGGGKKKMDDLDNLDVDDLLLLCDLHYLPFEHGPRAVGYLKAASWLVANTDRLLQEEARSASCKDDLPPEVREWYERATAFHQNFKHVAVMVDKFVNIPNRELLYEFYHYVSDMRSVLSLVNSYIKWNGLGRPHKEPFRGGEPEPWTMRGGLHAELRRLLPLEGQHDLFPLTSKFSVPAKVYTVRPYYPEDKTGVFTVCRLTCDNGRDGSDMFPDYPDLVGDDSIGGLLSAFPDVCFVAEDELGVVGYAAAAPDIRAYQAALVDSWLPAMRDKYPRPAGEGRTRSERRQRMKPQDEAISTFYNAPCPIPDLIHSMYPSFLHMRVLAGPLRPGEADAPGGPGAPPRRGQPEVAAKLMSCVARALKARGSTGVHTAVHVAHDDTIDFYARLGFDDITNPKFVSDELMLLGKPI